MLNYETILSSYDDKMTLMQWLKKVEEALNGASLTGVELKKKGNATFAWSFDFEDGTHIDTEYVTINEGDSVAEAYLLNGHLMIKLTNDEVIDAGNLKPVTSFSFNSQRHLIVNYGDGTSEDLGLIKGVSSFTINNNGHLIANYDDGTTQDIGTLGDFSNVDFVAKTLAQTNVNFSQTFNFATATGLTITNVYNKCEVVNNILYLIANVKVKNTSGDIKKVGGGWTDPAYITLTLPTSIASKIYDIDNVSAHDIGTNGKIITSTHVTCCSGTTSVSNLKTYNDFRFDFTNRSEENGVACYFRSNEIVELAIDEEVTLMARVAISLF